MSGARSLLAAVLGFGTTAFSFVSRNYNTLTAGTVLLDQQSVLLVGDEPISQHNRPQELRCEGLSLVSGKNWAEVPPGRTQSGFGVECTRMYTTTTLIRTELVLIRRANSRLNMDAWPPGHVHICVRFSTSSGRTHSIRRVNSR